MTKLKKSIKNKNIKTLDDLDIWRVKNIQENGSIMSRYSALEILYGENAAITILNELSIRQLQFNNRAK